MSRSINNWGKSPNGYLRHAARLANAVKSVPAIRKFEIHVCQQCLDLEGKTCNNPYCVFCRRTMEEVGEYLDVLLIRPIIDGRRIIEAVAGESGRNPVVTSSGDAS